MTRPLRAANNRYLSNALQRLPRYKELLSLEAQAEQKLAELTPVPDTPAELDPLANQHISDEWLDAELDHFEATQRLERRRRILIELKERATAGAAAILEASTDLILANLHAELAQLFHEVTQLADQLDGASSAEQAIAADLGPAWKKLTQLAAQYDELRGAQHVVMLRHAPDHYRSAQPTDGGEDTASDLALRNLDSVWPSWRTPGQGSERIINLDGSTHRYEPWPTDRAELILFLATSAAQPWIPTTLQLDALWKRRRERLNPNPQPIRTPPLLNKTPQHARTVKQTNKARTDA